MIRGRKRQTERIGSLRRDPFLNREPVFKIILVSPLQLLLWFLLIIPFLIVIYLSFVKWQPVFGSWTEVPWVWFANYQRMFTDLRFYSALGRTVLVVVISVGLQFLLGLGLALLFNRKFFGRKLFAAVVLYPMMLPWVVVGFIFYLLFQDLGLVNYMSASVLGPGAVVSWFREPVMAWAAIIAGDVWQWTPFVFLVLYSGLGALPREPTEAAMVLGASKWQIFRYVTFPMLKPIVIIAVVIRALETFKLFDLVFIMTGGGPGATTESLSLYIYRIAFKYGQLSYAATMAVIILILIAVVTRLAVRPLLREEV